MAILVRLDRVLLERRMSLTELADRVGVTIANVRTRSGRAAATRAANSEDSDSASTSTATGPQSAPMASSEASIAATYIATS